MGSRVYTTLRPLVAPATAATHLAVSVYLFHWLPFPPSGKKSQLQRIFSAFLPLRAPKCCHCARTLSQTFQHLLWKSLCNRIQTNYTSTNGLFIFFTFFFTFLLCLLITQHLLQRKSILWFKYSCTQKRHGDCARGVWKSIKSGTSFIWLN